MGGPEHVTCSLFATILWAGLISIKSEAFLTAQEAPCHAGRTVREMRAAWVATVVNIDWPKAKDLSTNQNKADLIELLDKLEKARINAVVLQVRPSGDALYASAIEPWSQYLTGAEGKAPDPLWDPLEFAVQEAHKRNMELHAWINPYRASMKPSLSGLASSNMAKTFPDAAYIYAKYVWMDPGRPEVQNRTRTVVKDMVTRYNLDAIHMDDYFYPYPDAKAGEFPDANTYQNYTTHGGSMSLSDWRRDNVNSLIQAMANDIKSIKPHVKFGISPFGIWKPGHPPQIKGFSSYDSLYADSRLWLQKGWVDYLSPQLYWQIEKPAQSFTALADWWTDGVQNPLARHVYPGLADYRVPNSGWDPMEIVHQVEECRVRWERKCGGVIHFSAKHLSGNVSGLTTDLTTRVYTRPSLVPRMTWLSDPSLPPPSPPVVVVVGGNKLGWSASDKTSVRSWVLYSSNHQGQCLVHDVLPVGASTVSVAPGQWVLGAVDRLGREVLSPVVTVVDDGVVG